MKTLLIGLDGGTFTVLDPLVAAGEMPNLAKFYRKGVRSKLRSSPLPITPQAWTSLSTGRSMGHHGINDFVRIELEDNKAYARFNTARDNCCETLWKHVSRAGMRVTVLNYFGIAPPEEIDGHSMAGFVPARHLRRSSYPPDLVQRLKDLGTFDVSLLGLEIDVEKQALSDMSPEKWIEWIDHHIAREQAWFTTLEHLMLTEPSHLTTVVFDGVDKVQHLAYRYLDPAVCPKRPSAWEAEVIKRCRTYFKKLDDLIGKILGLAGKDARVFIASDHGFTSSTEIVYINRWLRDEGLLTWKSEQPEDQNEAIFVDHLRSHLEMMDLNKTKAFALTPSSNGIFINVPPAEYEAFRDELVRKLYRIKAPDGGQVITEVKLREEWFPGPCMRRAPDLTLTLRDFGHISVLNASAVVIPRKEPWGTHHPDGVLLGLGKGLLSGKEVERRDILDVAPLLLHSLDLEIPDVYEGTFPETFYEKKFLKGAPPRIGSSTVVEPAVLAAEPADSADDDREIMERLRRLGYIE